MHLSIKLKLASTVVGGLALVALVNAGIARYNYQQDMRYAADQAVGSAARAFSSIEKREVDKLSSTLDALLGNPTLAAFFAQRDRDHLYEAALPIFQELRTRHAVTHWYFIDPPPGRTCFLRVHRPDLHDDPINRITFQTAVRTNETAAGKELGQTAFALRVVRAFHAGGRLLGYMELGQEIDDFLTRMKAETGSDFGLVVQKRFLDEQAWAATRSGRRNGWGDDPETVAIDTTSADLPIVGSSADVRAIPDGGRYLEPVVRGSSLFVRGVIPVVDAAGQRVGGLFVLRDVSALRDRALAELTRNILLVAGVALAMLVLLLVMFELLVFRRLLRMTTAMEDVATRLAGGDYQVGATIQPSAQDEIGRFEGFLGRFLAAIGMTLRELEKRRRAG